MPANLATAYYDPADNPTIYAEAAITGKRFVKVSDPKKVASQALSNTTDGGNIVCSPCGAGEAAFAVSEMDIAQDTLGTALRCQKIVPVTSGAAITAGAVVMSDSTGRAVTWTSAASEANFRVGIALNSPTAAGQDTIVALFI